MQQRVESAKKHHKEIGFSISNMCLSVDPFKSFYDYACGSWLKKCTLPKDTPEIGSFEELDKRNLNVLKDIIKACVKEPSLYKNGSIVADFYYSFMNKGRIERLRFEPVTYIMEKIDKLESKEDLQEFMQFALRNNIPAFMDVAPITDERNSNVYALHLYQGGLSLPEKSYYIEKMFEHTRLKYLQTIEKMFQLYGFDKKGAAKGAATVLRIETMLAKSSRSSDELRDSIKNYNKMQFEEVKKRYANIGIEKMLHGTLEEMPNYVIIGQPEFFDALNKIIEKTSIEDIKTYLRWQTLVSTAPLLHREAAKVIFDFFGREIAGTKKQRPRWKRAISLMGSLIGDALSELYVKENFGHEAKEKAASLITNIKRAFRERLEKLEWMSDDTKVKAIEKLDAMNVKLGYPKKFKDYLKLEINRNDLFGNYIRAYQFELDRTMKRIGKKVDKNEWDMNAYTVNAYYDATKNEIVIPAGILQPPFFDAKIDNAVNYGGIGGTIGHEITHGFDDDGSLYDKYGNINEWWSKQDRKKFNNLTKRIEDLYGSLEIKPGLKVNGKLTLGENIADLGGIHIAYDALQRSISNSKVNSRIDGFTQEQRFYIAWAQIWKLKITDNLMILNAKIDPHSPSRLRGSIPVITHHDFIKTFRENSALKEPSPKYGDVNLW